MTLDKGRLQGLLDFVFKDKTGLKPDSALTVVKTDLRQIDPEEDVLVWFGHSSYLVQVDGKRVLVDPVFCMASPVSFINKPFKGTDVYHPEDMPDIDYLVISHDHWDHLDYHTVRALKDHIGKVICGWELASISSTGDSIRSASRVGLGRRGSFRFRFYHALPTCPPFFGTRTFCQ